MRSSNGFRFSLQFKTLSDAHRQVGEFLEHLGNKKSEAVVAALTEYLCAHPEMLNKDNPVQVVAAYGFSEETLNVMIEAHIHKMIIKKDWELQKGDAQENTNASDKYETPLPDKDASALDVLLGGLEHFR